MGVGSDIFILEMAALVAPFNAMPENAVPSAEAPSAAGVLTGNDSLAGALTVEDRPSRRVLKHGEQYTGLSGLGRKGTVVDVSQSAQTAWWRRVREDERGRVEKDLTDIRKQTPWLLKSLRTYLAVAYRHPQWGISLNVCSLFAQIETGFQLWVAFRIGVDFWRGNYLQKTPMGVTPRSLPFTNNLLRPAS